MDEQLFQKPNKTGQVQQLTGIATRLKLAEDRFSNLRKRNQLTEEALLSTEKDLKADLRALTNQLVDLRKKILDIHTKVDMMQGELSAVVKKHEFAAVERYIDLWQPMRFVTREEAKKLIQDKMG